MAAKIPSSNMNVGSYLPHIYTIFAEKSVTEEELKRVLFSSKPNKTLLLGIFPNKLKIAKVYPIFKNGKKDLLTNSRPISVLPYFLKTLERLTYGRLHSYLTENKYFLKDSLVLDLVIHFYHAPLELIDQICECLDKKKYFLGYFVDLSKPFDT